MQSTYINLLLLISTQEGLARIDGLRDDDLFLTFDADELVKPEVVLFLKLYDGYPELVMLTLRWTAYGFFWQQMNGGQVSVTRRE
jgi:beta-1,4-mannosyl-glycoprotein beta-1,4-N-acetylglucosaminyltransferase